MQSRKRLSSIKGLDAVIFVTGFPEQIVWFKGEIVEANTWFGFLCINCKFEFIGWFFIFPLIVIGRIISLVLLEFCAKNVFIHYKPN